MAASFFFYDLETSGFDARSARIMQFAGQRTDQNLVPIGDPVNVLIKLTPDVLPSPDAILVTKITPQQTLAEGVTEAEFLQLFYDQVVQPDTIFVGFNSVRFDDEFMRFLHYRNFYDAYEWQWANGCSRWDILDVVRMTRALRPAGTEWPFAPDGKPTNRLEALTSLNKLDHSKAHDALSDVLATIAVARHIKTTQPELFAYLLGMRDKKKVAALVESNQPFVYTTGRYPSAHLHTSVAVRLSDHPDGGTLIYDLRHDPTPFLGMQPEELVTAWRYSKDPDALRLPVKAMKYNRCPAVAPMGVIKDSATQERLELDLAIIQKHRRLLKQHQTAFIDKLMQAITLLNAERKQQQASLVDDAQLVDGRLYDGFIQPGDKQVMRAVRVAEPHQLTDFITEFKDGRLQQMLPLYKARNYPQSLDADERVAWEEFCAQRLLSGGTASQAARYFARLGELAETGEGGEQQYILEELQLYGQSILPVDVAD